MADLVFAFDAAIDRPLPRLDAAPAAVSDAVAAAATDALLAAAATAREAEAAALVLFGRVLDPHRASPAQAALLRSVITGLADHGCRTVWFTADAAHAADATRMLGDPVGLVLATPATPVHLDIRGIAVELVSVGDGRGASTPWAASPDAGPGAAHAGIAGRRIVVGWDTGHWNAERWDDVPEGGHRLPSCGGFAGHTFCVWGSRRPHPRAAGLHHLPALQARSGHEAAAGCCGVLTLLDHPTVEDGTAVGHDALASRTDWRHHWRESPTHGVAWRTVSIASATGGDEELATAIWSAIEGLSLDAAGPLHVIRCHVECGTSVARRVRVAELSAETLARVRQLSDARGPRVWCQEILADPGESLVALGHSRSGAKPGSTTSFSTALADIVNALEQQPLHAVPADLARESAWLALELIEST